MEERDARTRPDQPAKRRTALIPALPRDRVSVAVLWSRVGLSRSATYGCPEIKVLRLGHRRLVASTWLEKTLELAEE